MKVINFILIIFSIGLPILICSHFVDCSELRGFWYELVCVVFTIVPFMSLYIVAKKSEQPEWAGLKNTGVAFYYGIWAVELSLLAGILSFAHADFILIISIMKSVALLFGIAFLCRILEWAGILQKLVNKLSKHFDK
ncbi:MAG: hypothetical protein ACI3ZF_04390 [Candidatus Cryptobacteroides sp.]